LNGGRLKSACGGADNECRPQVTAMRRSLSAPLLLLLAALAGCDQLGIESPAAATAKREAEGKAIGGACRHAGRAIEDCYTLNRKADKGAMFAGWREMNDYMRENKIEAVAPVLPPPGLAASAPKKQATAAEDEGDGADVDKADKKKHADAAKH
jgi:hypothetical protein